MAKKQDNTHDRQKDLVGNSTHFWAGGLIILTFFGGFLGWAAFAPLESAAIAPGVAVVEGSRKSVQHLEGGIIREIHVSEGAYVERGETLLILEDVKARADLDLLVSQRIAATAQAMRLYAERDDYRTSAVNPSILPKRSSVLSDTELEQRIYEGAGVLSEILYPGTHTSEFSLYGVDLSHPSIEMLKRDIAAQLDTDPEPGEPAPVLTLVDMFTYEERARQAVIEHIALFEAKHQAFKDQLRVTSAKIDQFKYKAEGLKARAEAQAKELHLLREEMDSLAPLVEKGLIQRGRILSMWRDEARLEGSIAEARAEIGMAQATVTELSAELDRQASARKALAATEFTTVLEKIDTLDSQITTAHSVLKRSAMYAPSSGVVHQLQVNTVGGVVMAGQKVLELVPQGTQIIIDAKLEPKDRDVVKVGMTAELKFSATGSRPTAPIMGEVINVSADKVTDPTTMKDYFLAKIAFDDSQVREVAGLDVHPGMQVSVMVLTGERTVLDYIVAPLSNALRQAMRES